MATNPNDYCEQPIYSKDACGLMRRINALESAYRYGAAKTGSLTVGSSYDNTWLAESTDRTVWMFGYPDSETIPFPWITPTQCTNRGSLYELASDGSEASEISDYYPVPAGNLSEYGMNDGVVDELGNSYATYQYATYVYNQSPGPLTVHKVFSRSSGGSLRWNVEAEVDGESGYTTIIELLAATSEYLVATDGDNAHLYDATSGSWIEQLGTDVYTEAAFVDSSTLILMRKQVVGGTYYHRLDFYTEDVGGGSFSFDSTTHIYAGGTRGGLYYDPDDEHLYLFNSAASRTYCYDMDGDLLFVGPYRSITYPSECVVTSSRRIVYQGDDDTALEYYDKNQVQTQWYGYDTDGSTSLGASDLGVSVPADNALTPYPLVFRHIKDMRDALETLCLYVGYPSDDDSYVWGGFSGRNLYYNAMGDRTKYGATGGTKTTWTRTEAQAEETPPYDIDVGEVYECVVELETARTGHGI